MARVLAIDDDRSIRHTIDKGLKPAGHDVVLAASGVEGLGWLIGLPLPIILILLFYRGCDF